jgi:crotonobetainyl-CoA:carnitine CoA-transferase CaiB-like acyl-CoA transferase
MLGNPFKYAGTPVLAYPPALGADTAEVFERIAGYSPEQIAQLAKSRAIAVATERGDKP